jgi:LuxR family transcriptional regulator
LAHGVVVSCGPVASRTIVGAARSDREHTDAEIAELVEVVQGLHEVGGPLDDVTPEMVEALRLAGDGRGLPGAAREAAIAEGALEARLSDARDVLGARTTGEAVEMAQVLRLL